MINIGIVGVGGLGSLFAERLVGHAKVTLIARGVRLQQLRNEGITVQFQGRSETTAGERFQIVDSGSEQLADALAGLDYLLFACKSQHTESLARQLRPLLDPTCHLVSIQNGVDNELVLQECFGQQVVGGMTVRFGSHLNGEGTVDVVGELICRFGEYPTGSSERVEQLVVLLADAGFAAEAVDDIRAQNWNKMVINCACNPVTALLTGEVAELYQSPSSRWIMQNLMREAASSAAADGVEISAGQLDQLSSMLASMPPLRSSMQVDAERGTPLELEGLTGAVIRRAASLGQEALVTSTIHHLLQARYPNSIG